MPGGGVVPPTVVIAAIRLPEISTSRLFSMRPSATFRSYGPYVYKGGPKATKLLSGQVVVSTAAAADGGPKVAYAVFGHKRDKDPQPRNEAWMGLVAMLQRHRERDSKDGPGWAPVVIKPNGRLAR